MKKLLLFTTILIVVSVNAQFRLVKDVNSFIGSDPYSFYVFNGRLFFSALSPTATNTRAIFVTDGTNAGTVPINYGTNNPYTYNDNANVSFFQYNSELYFDGRRAVTGLTANVHVSKIAGTAITANLIYDIDSAPNTNSPSRFFWAAGINNKLIFNPVTACCTIGFEPLVVDLLTPSNSGVLKNINATANTGSITSTNKFIALGTSCYFAANDGTNGNEVYKSDGTSAGTNLFLDINSGTANSDPDQFNVLGTNLTFVATDNVSGRELFSTTGAAGNITLIKDINTTGNSNPTNIKKIGSLLYFAANNGTNGNEIWRSNGTSTGTVLIKDINTTGDSNPTNFTAVGGTVYFTANSTSTGVELWKTNGTVGGTVLVELIPVTGGVISDLTEYNDKLYFVIRPTNNADRIWSSDGTATGTTQLSSLAVGNGGLVVFENELYVPFAFTTGTGIELCAYKDPALSTNEFQLNENAITLFPNPSKNYFELSGDVNIEKVEVYSIQGQLVKSFINQNQYAISDLAKGIYIVKINATQGNLNKTLIVE